MGCHPNNKFRQKYTNDMSMNAVFDGDYESDIIFAENIYSKKENHKIRVHLACNSSYFNNFPGNNCSNYTHKCSFSWTLIWYKILSEIISS